MRSGQAFPSFSMATWTDGAAKAAPGGPCAGIAEAASCPGGVVADSVITRLAATRARELAEACEQGEQLVEAFILRATNGEALSVQINDHRGVTLLIITCTAGAPQGAAARPAGRSHGAPSRPQPAKAATPTCGKSAGARSSPSAGISGKRLTNWRKKHNANGTLRPGAERRVAARSAKRLAGSPARHVAPAATRPALMAEAPKASSSAAPAEPAKHTMPREGKAAATAPIPSAGIRDEDRDSEMEVDDATKFAAECFVDGPRVLTDEECFAERLEAFHVAHGGAHRVIEPMD
jgi:hypothetical protein